MTSFVLASASPRRQQILHELGFRFRVCPSAASESDRDVFPGRIPVINAVAKAAAVADRFPDELVLGSDTIIEFREHIIGKPVDCADAHRILALLSGATHEVVTGVALLQRSRRIRCIFSARTAVTFRRLDDRAIAAYLERVHVLDKAGAYAIQECGEMIVERIDGPLDNVIGLPGAKVRDALRCCGVTPSVE